VLTAALIVTPLFAIPLAIAGSAATTTISQQAAPVVSGEWGYPLAGAYSKGRGFGHNPVIGCGFCSTDHQGYDMAQGCGSTIFAAGPGRIITAGSFYGWGNTVRIDHGAGLVTLYGHMQWESLRVSHTQAMQRRNARTGSGQREPFDESDGLRSRAPASRVDARMKVQPR